jgi:hypothetical protein
VIEVAGSASAAKNIRGTLWLKEDATFFMDAR